MIPSEVSLFSLYIITFIRQSKNVPLIINLTCQNNITYISFCVVFQSHPADGDRLSCCDTETPLPSVCRRLLCDLIISIKGAAFCVWSVWDRLGAAVFSTYVWRCHNRFAQGHRGEEYFSFFHPLVQPPQAALLSPLIWERERGKHFTDKCYFINMI